LACIAVYGTRDQICLVNFSGPGTGVVTLLAGIAGSACASADSMVYEVSDTAPAIDIRIYSHFHISTWSHWLSPNKGIQIFGEGGREPLKKLKRCKFAYQLKNQFHEKDKSTAATILSFRNCCQVAE
jgi:hypothetical protein